MEWTKNQLNGWLEYPCESKNPDEKWGIVWIDPLIPELTNKPWNLFRIYGWKDPKWIGKFKSVEDAKAWVEGSNG